MIAIIAALGISPALGADFTPITADTVYASGARIGDASAGASLEVPANWKAILPAGSEVLILAKDGFAGAMLVLTETDTSVEQVAKALNQPIPLDATSRLVPSAAPATTKQTVKVPYTVVGADPSMLASAEARVQADGLAIGCVSVGTDATLALVTADCTKLLDSVKRHEAPAPKPPTQPTGAAAKLAGRHLLYLKASTGVGGGSSSRRGYDLCSDGTVRFTSSMSMSSFGGVGDASMSGADAGQGTWSMTGAMLTIDVPDRSSETFTVDLTGPAPTVTSRSNWWFDGTAKACR